MQTVATKTVGSRSWISGDGLLSRQVEKRRLRVSVNRSALRTIARQQGPRPKLIPFVLSIPKRIDIYFERYPARRVLWTILSCGAGFYSGNTVTLSFGALAINDVLAAIITLVFYEIVSKAFYGAARPSLRLWFANCFKIGMVVALMADAVKLGG